MPDDGTSVQADGIPKVTGPIGGSVSSDGAVTPEIGGTVAALDLGETPTPSPATRNGRCRV